MEQLLPTTVLCSSEQISARRSCALQPAPRRQQLREPLKSSIRLTLNAPTRSAAKRCGSLLSHARPCPVGPLGRFVRPSRLLWACLKPLTVGCSGRRRRCRRSTPTLARSCAGLRNLRLLAQHGGMVANTGGGAGRRSRCVGLKACGPLSSVPVRLKRVLVARWHGWEAPIFTQTPIRCAQAWRCSCLPARQCCGRVASACLG